MPARHVALVREVPDSFAGALAGGKPTGSLDPVLARRQHAAYRAALSAGGFDVEVIPADESHPDCPFVEDVAVVIGSGALATRPGHPTRRGEVSPVAEVVERHLPVERMGGTGRLDGGDVLVVGTTVFAGRSRRSDEAGIEALDRFASARGHTVVPVEVPGVLHLKSAVTALDDRTLLAFPGRVDLEPFSTLEVVPVGGADPEAANVVRLPDGSILVAAHHEDTASLVSRRGFRPVAVDVSEFARADGGLTCLSIRMRSVLAQAPPYALGTSGSGET